MTDEKTPLEPPPAYNAAVEHTPVAAGADAPARQAIARAPLPLELPALMRLRGRRVILASASPRRKALLAQIGLTDVEVIPSTAPEDMPKSMSPFEYVLRTAEEKAMNVYRAEIDSPKGEPAIIIAADTVVVTTLGQILEKPRNEKEHIAVLKGLRDTGIHRVYTAVVCMTPLDTVQFPGYAIETAVEETAVHFDPEVTDELIVAYVKTREGADKAGGYGIQGIGSILVEKIEGSFDNVVGLPLRTTLRLIEKVMNPDRDMEDDAEDL